MAKIKYVADMMGLGLFTVGIYLILINLFQGDFKILGVVGGIVLAFSQAVFLWQKWFK